MKTARKRARKTSPAKPAASSVPPPVKLPPADARIPSPPLDFVPVSGNTYKGTLPKTVHRATMPSALADLRRFQDYVETFGIGAPPYEQVLATFDAAEQWSVMHDKARAWEEFARVQRGYAWQSTRAIMDRLRRLLALATRTDPSLRHRYPSLARLLNAQSGIARKAAKTRRANRASDTATKTAPGRS